MFVFVYWFIVNSMIRRNAKKCGMLCHSRVPDFQGEFLEFDGYDRREGCGEEVARQT